MVWGISLLFLAFDWSSESRGSFRPVRDEGSVSTPSDLDGRIACFGVRVRVGMASGRIESTRRKGKYWGWHIEPLSAKLSQSQNGFDMLFALFPRPPT